MSWGDEKYHRVATAILLSSDYKVIELLTYVEYLFDLSQKAFDTRQKGFRLRPKIQGAIIQVLIFCILGH